MGPQTIFFPVKCAIECPSLGCLAFDVLDAMGLDWEVVVYPQNHNTIPTSGAHPHYAAQATCSAESERETWKMHLNMLRRGKDKAYNL